MLIADRLFEAAAALQEVLQRGAFEPEVVVRDARALAGVAAAAERPFSELPGRPVIRRRDDQSREEGPENGCERRGC
ncbi:hypothetical protein GCM10010256_65360 [Streptomyces coeruleorubidus]|nr:hypothetical protein GCM10010256_65360 [Streptomyces coeruleorubidus]